MNGYILGDVFKSLMMFIQKARGEIITGVWNYLYNKEKSGLKMIFNKICRGYAFRIAVQIKMIILISLIVLAGSASAKTVTVDAGGGANYTIIQDAINETSDGDIIFVNSGTYYENVNISKQLILIGMDTGGGKPVIDASGSDNAITLSMGNSILDGFAVTNGSIGIDVTSDFNVLGNNSAMNNTERGIALTNASNNTLANNSAGSNGIFGIAILDGSNRNVLSGSNVLNNGNAGIFLRDSSSNILNNNTAILNSVQGIQLMASIKNILVNNTVSNSDYGVYLESSSDNNILSSNTAYMNRINGIFLTGSSNNTVYNNHFNNTNNFSIDGSNAWNTTLTNGTNIIQGPNIGGNYWANPNGTGFSQTCSDANGDGICDSSYMLDSNNIDYLPLASVLVGDLNGNGISADIGDLVLMKRASIGEIPADSRYDLNGNGIPADVGDLVLMKRASIGEITLPVNMT